MTGPSDSGPSDLAPFDLAGPLPRGRVVIEASAGTGKTYALTNIAVRHLVETDLLPEQLLMVTYTRAAANELRDRARGALHRAVDVLATGVAPPEHPWMEVLLRGDARERRRRESRARDASARLDDATITTIHGFCQQALGQAGLRSGADPDATLVENADDLITEACRDVLIDVLIDHPDALPTGPRRGDRKTPSQVERALVAVVKTVLQNPEARLQPPRDADPGGDLWLDAVHRALREVRERQQQRREIGFDRLVTDLRDALVHPVTGPAVSAQLSARYGIVLVDEFQDTDRVQWTVFERGFSAGTLVTVGDPKQAIYRFRGADVHAYLAAVDRTSAQSLATNHRSDALLLDGLGRLLDGAELGDPRITFSPVASAPGAPLDALGAGAALQLRVVRPHDDLKNAPTDKHLAMPLIRQVVLADLVSRTVDLLEHGKISRADGPTTSVERVQPGDIAVLVPSHAEAANVAEALRRARVPVVRTRTGSVLATSAALQWRLLLAALARPHHAPTVRAAALGWFFGADAGDVGTDGDERELVGLQERCASFGERMRCAGVAAAYDELKSMTGMLPTLLGRDDGDRELTDLDHIGELLSARTSGQTSEPAQVLRLLEELIADDDDHAEATMRRIESDAAAVQVTTIHGAKGLEYPIVMVPFGFKPRQSATRPYTFVGDGDARTIDVASFLAWADGTWTQNARKAAAEDECDGDALRLLYVALTRARHRVEVWWACCYRWYASPLARVLLDRDTPDGPILNTPGKPFDLLTIDDVTDRVRALARASDGTIDVTEVPARVAPVTWTRPETSPAGELSTAQPDGRATLADPAWRRWSFTSLASMLHDAGSAALGSGDTAVAEAPVTGGGDEAQPDEEVDDSGGAPLTSSPPTPSLPIGRPAAAAWGFPDGAAGQRFGTFAHTVLERLDFTSADLDGDLRVLVADHAREAGLDLDEAHVARGLAAALRAPLGWLFDHRPLASLAPRDRLAELTFDLPLAAHLSADASGRRARLSAGTLVDVLLEHLPADDPLRPCLAALPRELRRVDIAGWMYGSIDAVFRIPEGAGHRYVLVDYKTNRLHPPGAGEVDAAEAYRPEHLAAAMAQHHYALQATIYAVALHRYLRWRLGAAYRPDEHLGGAAYLFLRGMGSGPVGADGGAPGVFAWRPPSAAIVAVDRFFADGGS